MKRLNLLLGWLLGLVLVCWRITCRYRIENDPRPALRAGNTPYIYALLHAHQLAAVFVNDEPDMAAMVSRSADGDLLAPSLHLRRVRAVRGSSRKAGVDKGGQEALDLLGVLVQQRIPALLAVDGPRGPRGHVYRGVITLAQRTGATILPTAVIPSRRIILHRSWDRFQIPLPFAAVRLIFGAPIVPTDNTEALQAQLGSALAELEATHDAAEFANHR